MPWQDLLSPTQRVQVLALPTSLREYEELYTLTPTDLEFVAAHRRGKRKLHGIDRYRNRLHGSRVLSRPQQSHRHSERMIDEHFLACGHVELVGNE